MTNELYNPGLLNDLLAKNVIKLVNVESILKGFSLVEDSYYGNYTYSLLGIDYPYCWEDFYRSYKFKDALNKTFGARMRLSQVHYTNIDGKMEPFEVSNFPCTSIWVCIKEDNTSWSSVGTEFAQVCSRMRLKPCKSLPVSSTRSRVEKFRQKWPEIQQGLDIYLEAVKLYYVSNK